MAKPTQEQVLKEIGRIWKKYPELRLCQLLSNACSLLVGPDLYYVEDFKLLIDLQTFDKSIGTKSV